MKVAVVGSRNLNVRSIQHFLPAETTEIVSGGAKGVDTAAKKFAKEMQYKYTELCPDYKKYGKVAPLKRNDEIIDYADLVIAIWDGKSKGTKYTIDRSIKIGKSLIVYRVFVCGETNLLLVEGCDYYNMTTLGNDMLKKIILAELDCEFCSDVDTQLINECIRAILTNKADFKLDPALKKKIADFETDNDDMLIEITKKYCES